MSLHSAIKHLSQKVYASAHPRVSVLGLVLFIVLSVPLLIHKSQNLPPDAIFAPETIGLGQGVAACFSGTPSITCNSAGQYVITATIQDPPDSLNIQGFRVIFATNPNDPEHSVKAEINNISGSGGTYSTTFNGSPGTEYWPISFRYADGAWAYADVESSITGPTCPPGGVQGYKVDSNRQAAFAEQTITVQGGNQPASSGTNPYQIYGLTRGTYNVTSSGPSNHSVSYCVGGGCSYYTLGNNVNVNVPSGSSVDLWWQYSPWTIYCTGGSDPNGNSWQWWQYDAVPDPNRHYEFVRPGDGTCTPTPTGTLTLTTNPCQIAAGQTTCQPYFDWSTVNTESNGTVRVAFNIINNAGTGSYATETAYASSNTASGTGGAGAALAAGTYTIKLYGLKSNNWVLLDSKTQVVNAAPANNPSGSFDTADCSLLQGWAYDPDSPSDSIEVHVYEGDTAVAVGWANVARSDVNTALGIGGNHGFSIATPASLKDGNPHTLKIYGINVGGGTNTLIASTRTITCAAGSPDLTVSGITPTSAIAGTATTFSATIYNTGTGSTGIGFKNFYQVKSGTVGYTPTNFFAKLLNIAHAAETITDLGSLDMGALASGSNGTASQTYTFPAAGVYGIRVCADKADRNGTNGNPNGLIPESNEDNNCGGWTDVNVTAACTPGGACSVSNACNYASGTYNSSCNCSASVPPVPSNFGNSCASVPATNACGMAGSGTILCNGTCSATTPSDTLCLPTVTLSADPTRVRKDTSTKLTWGSTAATSCSLTGQNGFSSIALSGTNVDSTPLDAQTTFTLTCSNTYGSKSASVIVNLLPTYIEQ